MVTGLQFLALACSSEYSWQRRMSSAFVDVKDVGGAQTVSESANAPHPTCQQGTNPLHPFPPRFVELEGTIGRDGEVRAAKAVAQLEILTSMLQMARLTNKLPDGHSSFLTHQSSLYTGHNPKPLDIPLDEESRLPRDRRIIKRPVNPKQGHRRSTTRAPVSLALTSLNGPSIWARRPEEHWPSAFNVGPAPMLPRNQSRSELLPETRLHLNWTVNCTPRGIFIPSPIPTIPSEYTGEDMELQEQSTDDDRLTEDDGLRHISSLLDPEEDDERLGLHGLPEDDFDMQEEDEYYTTASEYSEYSEYESTGRGNGWCDGESFLSPRTSPSPALSQSPLPGLKARPASPPHPRCLESVSGADMTFAMAVERALKRGCRGELYSVWQQIMR